MTDIALTDTFLTSFNPFPDRDYGCHNDPEWPKSDEQEKDVNKPIPAVGQRLFEPLRKLIPVFGCIPEFFHLCNP
jgi:hypothetical protein